MRNKAQSTLGYILLLAIVAVVLAVMLAAYKRSVQGSVRKSGERTSSDAFGYSYPGTKGKTEVKSVIHEEGNVREEDIHTKTTINETLKTTEETKPIESGISTKEVK